MGDCTTLVVRDVRTQEPLNIHVDYSLLSSEKYACRSEGGSIKIAHGTTAGQPKATDGLQTTNGIDYTCPEGWVMTETKIRYVEQIVADAVKRIQTSIMAVYQTAGESSISLNNGLANCNAKTGLTDVFTDLPLPDTTADFYLYVTANPILIYDGQGRKIQSNAASWPCHYAKKSRRPIVGMLAIQPDQIYEDIEYMSSVVVHELIQSLGWNPELAISGSYWLWNENFDGTPVQVPVDVLTTKWDRPGKAGYNYFEPQLKNDGEWAPLSYRSWKLSRPIGTPPQVTVIQTPNVVKQARIHFNCPVMTGLEVEDYTQNAMNFKGDFTDFPEPFTVLWERRLTKGEVMNMQVDTGAALSILTLAMMQDTGYYKADYSAAEYLQWGDGAGCYMPGAHCYLWASAQLPQLNKFTCVSLADPDFNEFGPVSQIQCMPKGTRKGTCNNRKWDESLRNADPLTPREYLTYQMWRSSSSSYYHTRGANMQSREIIARQSGGCDAMMDYCPVYEAVGQQSNCLDPTLLNGAGMDCTTAPCKPYSVATSASGCFSAAIKYSDLSYNPQLMGTCLAYSCSPSGDQFVLNVEVGNSSVVCTDAREVTPLTYVGSVSGSLGISGFIRCPHATNFCSMRQELEQISIGFVNEASKQTVAGEQRDFEIRATTRSGGGREVTAMASNQIAMCVVTGKVDDAATSRLTYGGKCERTSALELTHKACSNLSPDDNARSAQDCHAACCRDTNCEKWQWLTSRRCIRGTGTCTASAGRAALFGASIYHEIQSTPPEGALKTGESCTVQYVTKLGFSDPAGFTKFSIIFQSLTADVIFYGIGTNFRTQYVRKTLIVKPGPPYRLKIVKPANNTEIESQVGFGVEVDVVDFLGNPAGGTATGSECPWGAKVADTDTNPLDGNLVIGGKCYQYFSTPMTRSGARERCRTYYGAGMGSLAAIPNKQVEDLFATTAAGKYWTGLQVSSTSTPLNVIWDSGVNPSWWKSLYGNPINADYESEFNKGCCLGLWVPEGGYVKTTQYSQQPTMDGCIIYNPTTVDYYPYEATLCGDSYPFFCEFKASLDVVLDLVNAAGLVDAETGIYYGAGRVQFTSVKITRQAIGGMDLEKTALLQATSPSDPLILGGSVMLVWKESPLPKRIRAYFLDSFGSKSNTLISEAGETIMIYADPTDVSGNFVSWSENMYIEVWDPTSEDAGLLISYRCIGEFEGGCVLTLTKEVHTWITRVGKLEVTARSGSLERIPERISLEIVANDACKIVPQSCPSNAEFNTEMGALKFLITDCYGNPVCEETERSVSITGNSNFRLSTTTAVKCAANPVPTSCCSSLSGVGNEKKCRESGCLWGDKLIDENLCKINECCYSRNGGDVSPLTGGASYRSAEKLCFPNKQAILFKATERPFVRNANCDFNLAQLSNTFEDIYYIKPKRSGNLQLVVEGHNKKVSQPNTYTEVGQLCVPTADGTAGRYDSYRWSSDDICNPVSKYFDVTKCKTEFINRDQCMSRCTALDGSDSKGKCIGFQYFYRPSYKKTWRQGSGRTQIMNDVSKRTGCLPDANPWKDTWVSMTDSEVLQDMYDECVNTRANNQNEYCCGVDAQGVAKTCPASPVCVLQTRIWTGSCPVDKMYSFRTDDGKFQCCEKPIVVVNGKDTCPDPHTACPSEQVARRDGSWTATLRYNGAGTPKITTVSYWGTPSTTVTETIDNDVTCATGKRIALYTMVGGVNTLFVKLGCAISSSSTLATILDSERSFSPIAAPGRSFIGCFASALSVMTYQLTKAEDCQARCGSKYWSTECAKSDGSFTCKCFDTKPTETRELWKCFNQKSTMCSGDQPRIGNTIFGIGNDDLDSMALYGVDEDNVGFEPCVKYHSFSSRECQLFMEGRDAADTILDDNSYSMFRRGLRLNSDDYVNILETGFTGTIAQPVKCFKRGLVYTAPLPRISVQLLGPGVSLADLSDNRDNSALWSCFPSEFNDELANTGPQTLSGTVSQGKYYAVKVTLLEDKVNWANGIEYTIRQRYGNGGSSPLVTDALLGCTGSTAVDPTPQCTPGFTCPVKCGSACFTDAILPGLTSTCEESTLEVRASADGLEPGSCSISMSCAQFQFTSIPDTIVSAEPIESDLIVFSVLEGPGSGGFHPENIDWELTVIDCNDKVVKSWTSGQQLLKSKNYVSDESGIAPSWFPGYYGTCQRIKLNIKSTSHSIKQSTREIIVLPGLPYEVAIKSDVPRCMEACDQNVVPGCQTLKFSIQLKTKISMNARTDGVLCTATALHYNEPLDDYIKSAFTTSETILKQTVQGETVFSSGYARAGQVKIVVDCQCGTCGPQGSSVTFQKVQGFVDIYPAAPSSMTCVKSPKKALAVDDIDLAARLWDVYGNVITDRSDNLRLLLTQSSPGAMIGDDSSFVQSGDATWTVQLNKVTSLMQFTMAVAPVRLDTPKSAFSFVSCLNDYTQNSILDSELCVKRVSHLLMTPEMCARECSIFPMFVVTAMSSDGPATECICSMESTIIAAYSSASSDYCELQPCGGTSNYPCGAATANTDHRYLAVYRRETSFPIQLAPAQCPGIAIFPNRPVKLFLKEQPCNFEGAFLNGDYSKRCGQVPSSLQCPQAAVGQELEYVIEIRDAGDNVADVAGIYKGCANPRNVPICEPRFGEVITNDGNTVLAQGVCQEGYKESMIGIEVTGFDDTAGRIEVSPAVAMSTSGGEITFTMESSVAACLVVEAVGEGLEASQTAREICFHSGPISTIEILDVPDSQAALAAFPLMTANVYDKEGNPVRWSTAKLAIDPWDDGSVPGVTECLAGNDRVRTVNSLYRLGSQFGDETADRKAYHPVAALKQGTTQFGGFSYSALEPSLSTECFRLRLRLRRDASRPSVLGCPAGAQSDVLKTDLELTEDEYTTIVETTDRIVIIGPTLALVSPETDHITVKAGDLFSTVISLILGRGEGSIRCWEGAESSGCNIPGFTVSQELVSGPTTNCPKCGRDVPQDGRIMKFTGMLRTIAGEYNFRYWGKANTGISLPAPVDFRVTIIAGDPSKLVFIDCISGVTVDAGELFQFIIEVHDSYDNPSSAWTTDITLRATQQIGFFGRGANYVNWEFSPPTINMEGHSQAVFNRLAITKASKYFLVAMSPGLKSAECMMEIVAADPDSCVAYTSDFPFEPQLEMIKAGKDFSVRVEFFDIYNNPVTDDLKNFWAHASAVEARGQLYGDTDKNIMGSTVKFTLNYHMAPEEISIAIEVPDSSVQPCQTKPIMIVAAEPCCLKIVEIREQVGGLPKSPLSPIAGPQGGVVMSPLRAGESFCVKVEIRDQFGNVVDESDPDVRALYEIYSDPVTDSLSGGAAGCEPQDVLEVEDDFGFGDLGGFNLGGGFGSFDIGFGTPITPFSDLSDIGEGGDHDNCGGIDTQTEVGLNGGSIFDVPPVPISIIEESTPEVDNPVFPSRRISLRRSHCSRNCKKLDDELGGNTFKDSMTGYFDICGVTYSRSECIYVEASSTDLNSDITPKICVSHAPWAKLECMSETRRVAQGQPFAGIFGTLYDSFGNIAETCGRDGTCSVTVQELEGTSENGYVCCGLLTDPNLAPGELSGDDLTRNGDFGSVSFSGIRYNRGRAYGRNVSPADPLRLEIVGRQGEIRARCGPMTVVGVRVFCSESPNLVLAGSPFSIRGLITKYNVDTDTYDLISCVGAGANTNCQTQAFAEIAYGGYVRENTAFNTRHAAGTNAVAGRLDLQDLLYYRSSQIVPILKPLGPTVNRLQWFEDSSTDDAPPGECDTITIAPAVAYEMCMGSRTGSFKEIVGKVFEATGGTPLNTLSNVATPSLCMRRCLEDNRCERWSFIETSQRCILFTATTETMTDNENAASGCRDANDAACAAGIIAGGCQKCKTALASDTSCGSCPAKPIKAGSPLRLGMHIHDLYGNKVGYPTTSKVVVSCKVTSAAPKRNPEWRSRLYPNVVSRGSPIAETDLASGLQILGSMVTSSSTLRVAGTYGVTCWADIWGPNGRQSGIPDVPSPDYAGGVVWTPIVQRSDVSFGVGETQFNKLLAASHHRIIKRVCESCPEGFREIYVVVRTTKTNIYGSIVNFWSRIAVGDVELYSSYADAVERTHKWPINNCLGTYPAWKTVCDTKTTEGDCNDIPYCVYESNTCNVVDVGMPGFCSRTDALANNMAWGFTHMSLELFGWTKAEEWTMYVETAPGCSPRQGLPVDEGVPLERTESLDECVALVKEEYSGMGGEQESNGAYWNSDTSECFAVFGEWDTEIIVDKARPGFTCDFPLINEFEDGACYCGGFRCPCSAPPRSDPLLRKECQVRVIPAEPDHLRCLQRTPDVFAGVDTTIMVAVRDRFGNRVVAADGGEVHAYFPGVSVDPVPAQPTSQFHGGIATLTTRFSKAEDVRVYVSSTLDGLVNRQAACPATVLNDRDECPPYKITCPSTKLKCCAGKRLCPTKDQIAICPADLDHAVFITQPDNNVKCHEEGHVASERRIPAVTVELRDMFGNTKTLTAISVSIMVATVGPTGMSPTGALKGTLTRRAVNGVVVFNDLTYDKAEKIILRIEAIENFAIIAQDTVTFEMKSGWSVNVCPGDVCQIVEKSAPDDCTFDVVNEDPVEIELQDRAGNTLLDHQVSGCRISLKVTLSDRIDQPWELGSDPSTKPIEQLQWRRVTTASTSSPAAVWGHAFTKFPTSKKMWFHGGLKVTPKQLTSNVIEPIGRSSVWEFDIDSKQWSENQLPTIAPTDRTAGSGSFSRGSFGGECYEKDTLNVGEALVAAPISACDKAGPSQRIGHVIHGVVGTQGEEILILFGGRSDTSPGGCCNGDMWRWTKAAGWEQLDLTGNAPSLRPRLWQTNSVIFGHTMYVWSGIGGESYSDANPIEGIIDGSNQFYSIDISKARNMGLKNPSLTWAKVQLPASEAKPRGRLGAMSVLYGSRWYIMGGTYLGIPAGDIWSIDLANLVAGWRLDNSDGPAVSMGTAAIDTYRKEIVIMGGTRKFSSFFGDYPAGKESADSSIRIFSIEDQDWITDRDPAGGVGMCYLKSALEHKPDASGIRCSRRNQASCTGTVTCGGKSRDECIAEDTYTCGWNGLICIRSCAYDASGEKNLPLPRIAGGNAYYFEHATTNADSTAVTKRALFFFGGVVQPTVQSNAECTSGSGNCVGDSDVWYLEPKNRIDKTPRPLAWDLRPYEKTCTGTGNCNPFWDDQGRCNGEVGCTFNANAQTNEEAVQCGSDDEGCVILSGQTSMQMTTSNHEFDNVIVSSVRNLIDGYPGRCVPLVSGSACLSLLQPECTTDVGCRWDTTTKPKDMQVSLSVSVKCPMPEVTPLCKPPKPKMLENVMRCSRCKLQVLPDSSPRVGSRTMLAGSNLLGAGQSPYDLHRISGITVAVTDPNGRPIANNYAETAAGSIRLKAARIESTRTSTLDITAVTESVTINTDMMSFIGDTELFGATISTVPWKIHSTPTILWMRADHDGVCQSSEPWPLNVVPGVPCQWKVRSQPSTVMAGSTFTVQVSLYDEYNNIAYCDVQRNHWRHPAGTRGKLMTVLQDITSWKNCKSMCEGRPRCTAWNYVYGTRGAVVIDSSDNVFNYPTGSCALYRGLTTIPDNGWAEVSGAVTGTIGGIDCEGAYLSMEALSFPLKAEPRGVLRTEKAPLGEGSCYEFPASIREEARIVRNDNACIRCCEADGFNAILTAPNMCFCEDVLPQGRLVGCDTPLSSVSKVKLMYREILEPHRKLVTSHKVSFERVWHNKAEDLIMAFQHSIDRGCDISYSGKITVIPNVPHHMELKQFPKTWHAPDCGGTDGPFTVKLQIVDFWRNVVPVRHQIIAIVEGGLGSLGGGTTWSDAGNVEFLLTYNKAEFITLFVSDLDISSDGSEGQRLESLNDVTTTAGSIPQCGTSCSGDSCLRPTASQCCLKVGPIKILTGPASRLFTKVQPPREIRSYGEGDCDAFEYTVQLLDRCDNPIKAFWSAQYATPFNNAPLSVSISSSRPEKYPNSDPAEKYEGLSVLQLADGEAVIKGAHMMVDPAITFLVWLEESPTIRPAHPRAIRVNHCIPRKLRILEPKSCHDLTAPISVIGSRQKIFDMTVAVLDNDGNICNTENPLSFAPIGCFTGIERLTTRAPLTRLFVNRNNCMRSCFETFSSSFFALSNGYCYCSSEVPRQIVSSDDDSCSPACEGGEAYCGGDNTLLLFELRSSYSNVNYLVETSITDPSRYNPLDPRLTSQTAAGMGGELVGTLAEEAELGIAVLNDAVWLPDSEDREDCFINPQGNDKCSGQTVLAVKDGYDALEGDTCNVKVENDKVVCSGPDIIRVGEEFDVSAYISSKVAAAMMADFLEISVFDEQANELSVGDTAFSTTTIDSVTGYPEGYRPADRTDVPISEWKKSTEEGITKYILRVDPRLVLSDDNKVWFPRLKFLSRIPGSLQEDTSTTTVTRTITVQSDFAEECKLKIKVLPGKVTKCGKRSPKQTCTRAGQVFDFAYTVRDEMNNIVNQDTQKCLTLTPGNTCPEGSSRYFPQNTLWKQYVEANLLNPSVFVEVVGVGVTTRRKYGSVEFYAEDSNRYIDDLGVNLVFDDARPIEEIKAAVHSGAECVVLRKSIKFISEGAATDVTVVWKSIPCANVPVVACVPDIAPVGACSGSTFAVVPQSLATVSLLNPDPTTAIIGSPLIYSNTGLLNFNGYQITKANNEDESFTVKVVIRDPVGDVVNCGTQMITVNGEQVAYPVDQFEISISPSSPVSFTASIAGYHEIVPGKICLSCSPYDEFAITAKAWDVYGNLASWDCLHENKWSNKVGRLVVSRFTGNGRLVSTGDADIAFPTAHTAVTNGRVLDHGIVVFSNMRYTGTGNAIFMIEPRAWAPLNGPKPKSPTVCNNLIIMFFLSYKTKQNKTKQTGYNVV